MQVFAGGSRPSKSQEVRLPPSGFSPSVSPSQWSASRRDSCKAYTLPDFDAPSLAVAPSSKQSRHFRCSRLRHQQRMSSGSHPVIGIRDARLRRDRYRALVAQGIPLQREQARRIRSRLSANAGWHSATGAASSPDDKPRSQRSRVFSRRTFFLRCAGARYAMSLATRREAPAGFLLDLPHVKTSASRPTLPLPLLHGRGGSVRVGFPKNESAP
ncbi:Arm DNA-binding domain-containing protein [Tahibacter sp. UC22_41]|uniref:Arm DNA-binding domain-containing protein n=1 Tax=Tahibacter sp. UC22_41 TaxID=3350178 RepID=UPI0036D8D42A